MSILGVPESDEPVMLKLTQELFGSSDPDLQRSFRAEDIFDVVRDFEAYFTQLTTQRRKQPQDDVAAVIANGRVEACPFQNSKRTQRIAMKTYLRIRLRFASIARRRSTSRLVSVRMWVLASIAVVRPECRSGLPTAIQTHPHKTFASARIQHR